MNEGNEVNLVWKIEGKPKMVKESFKKCLFKYRPASFLFL